MKSTSFSKRSTTTIRAALFASAALAFGIADSSAQITDRPRPKEWENLAPGARFRDRFLPMRGEKLSSETWGASNVIPRYVDNGIEDREYSYWGGNVLRGEDGKYHLFVCGWLESSPHGHGEWGNSIVFRTTSDKPHGPFIRQETLGKGHNPEVFRLKDGRFAVYVLMRGKREAGYYIADKITGPWTRHALPMDTRDRRLIEGKSNLTFSQREDGSYIMVCRGGGVWFSQDGVSTYAQVTDRPVYPVGGKNLEDPVIWRDNVQYHLIVNDWMGRLAYYLRSKDGVNWVVDPGEAYTPNIAKHASGKEEDWFKYERLKVLQDQHGRAVQANFAVIDVLKPLDKGNDNHSSKNIAIPLNPGVLLTILDKEPITVDTKEIRVKIVAEPGFNPHTDIDVNSLRFGASTEVNFGRGAKVKGAKKDGADLVVTFAGEGNGIKEDEFAPKLLGRDAKGGFLFGYARLPYVNYLEPILSARRPDFLKNEDNKFSLSVEVQNFGQVVSQGGAELKVEFREGNKKPWKEIGRGRVSALKSFEKTAVSVGETNAIEGGKEYLFKVTISVNGKTHSIFELKTKV